MGRNVLILIVWLLATASIAFTITRFEIDRGNQTDVRQDAEPVGLSARSTVSLTSETIQPIVSGDGIVVRSDVAFDLEVPVTPAALAYQLLQAPATVKAVITGGPAGFDCAWLGLAPGSDGQMAMRCRIPPEVTVIAGLTGTIVLGMQPAVERMALPATAVVGQAERGQVVVVSADGSTSVRNVQIGSSDTFWIEILSGLTPEETVLANPIESDFRANR